MTLPTSHVAALIRSVRKRKGQKQAQFAQFLEISQSQVCRYELGKSSPSKRVIDICMQQIHTNDEVTAPSAEDLAQRVRTALADPDKELARSAIASVLAAITNGPTGR
jgi:transcriptional regulator with XRE-family HTH domain